MDIEIMPANTARELASGNNYRSIRKIAFEKIKQEIELAVNQGRTYADSFFYLPYIRPHRTDEIENEILFTLESLGYEVKIDLEEDGVRFHIEW